MIDAIPRPDWQRDLLLENLAQRATDYLSGQWLTLEEVSLGLPVSWAVVRDGHGVRALGTALTPVGEGRATEPMFQDLPADWREWPLDQLPARIMADHPLERCLALAVINAVSQYRLVREDMAGLERGQGRGHVVRWVAGQRPQRVVMIGNMHPLVTGLTEAGIVPAVFERNPGNRSGALVDAQEWAWLAEADGLIVTGATLVNHTLAPLIALSPKARFRILVGFSAQVHPEFLAGSGISHVFSLHLEDVDGVRRRLQVGNWDAMFDNDAGYIASLDHGCDNR